MGFVLFGIAFVSLLHGAFEGTSSAATTVQYVLGITGLACHIAAVATSVQSWRLGGGVPVVALGYVVLIAVVLVGDGILRYRSQVRRAERYREDPRNFDIDTAGDGVDVEDANGVWHVALDRCPNAPRRVKSFQFSPDDGMVEIVGDDYVSFMVLHVAERRVECVAREIRRFPPVPPVDSAGARSGAR